MGFGAFRGVGNLGRGVWVLGGAGIRESAKDTYKNLNKKMILLHLVV